MIKGHRKLLSQLKNKRGYTLIELMTVSIIISILAAISFALLSRMRTQATETSAMSALNAIATGYEMYYYHYSAYPQWGPDELFSNPKLLLDFMSTEEYFPTTFRKSEYDPISGYMYGIVTDYALEIVMFDPTDPTVGATNTYFVILHPYNFQRDALAIGTNAPSGWVAVRPRRGPDGGDYRSYNLYTPIRGGAED